MIIVIADDLTGAAEVAGIGLRYNMNVEMSTTVNANTDADLLVIATDTRSMKEADAITEIERITNEVMLLQPELIYKKIDSVLRGHVIAELKSQLKILNLTKALVVAANPSLGRTISNGNYFYNDQPIHLSSFANDPEFAITSSDVLEMLRTKNEKVKVRKISDDISSDGIFIGEVANAEDIKLWADKIDKTILPTGGSDFFSAILDTLYSKTGNENEGKLENTEQTTLFVCGSTFNKSRETIKEIKSGIGPVSYMPSDIITTEKFDPEIYQLWTNEIVSFIHSKGKAIVAIDAESVKDVNVSAGALREKTAWVVKEVFDKINIHELFIEGGSTAAAIIRELGFETFIPVKEFSQGVVRMEVSGKEDLFITVKPGSYKWSEEVWNFD